jgi:hypothetical protein
MFGLLRQTVAHLRKLFVRAAGDRFTRQIGTGKATCCFADD